MLCTALQLCTVPYASWLLQKKAPDLTMSIFAAVDWQAVLKHAEHHFRLHL